MYRLRTRILLINDSPSALVWQLVLLQEEEYDTLTANTTGEGVRIAKLERPDLVILDVSSRSAHAVAAAAELRADPATRHIPILIVGASGGRLREDSAEPRPWDGHIGKPFDGVEYLEKIRELLGRRPGGSGR